MKIILTKTDNILKQYVVYDVLECSLEGLTLFLVLSDRTRNYPLINIWSWDCMADEDENPEGVEELDEDNHMGFLAEGVVPMDEEDDEDEDDDDLHHDEDYDEDITIIGKDEGN